MVQLARGFQIFLFFVEGGLEKASPNRLLPTGALLLLELFFASGLLGPRYPACGQMGTRIRIRMCKNKCEELSRLPDIICKHATRIDLPIPKTHLSVLRGKGWHHACHGIHAKSKSKSKSAAACQDREIDFLLPFSPCPFVLLFFFLLFLFFLFFFCFFPLCCCRYCSSSPFSFFFFNISIIFCSFFLNVVTVFTILVKCVCKRVRVYVCTCDVCACVFCACVYVRECVSQMQ